MLDGPWGRYVGEHKNKQSEKGLICIWPEHTKLLNFTLVVVVGVPTATSPSITTEMTLLRSSAKKHTSPSHKKSRYGSRAGQTSSTLTRFIENTCNI
jgi:hypothetical protein